MTADFTIEWVPSDVYSSALPPTEDPFRHRAGANSHNHHSLHPWGDKVSVGSKGFDSLYAEENNKYMYHLWYNEALSPYLATNMLKIEPLSDGFIANLISLLHKTIDLDVESSLSTPEGKSAIVSLQKIIDNATKGSSDPIFVRLGATSAKDSFANGAPTTKPGPLPPMADIVLRRLLTSGRVGGRLLALQDKIWSEDPGEALVIQSWSPDIRLENELRVFCYQGKITAISQDIWWEKTGWRMRYSDGLVDSILDVWDKVRPHLPFDTCTMDVLVLPTAQGRWDAKVIEFNGFGPHLNTGSDLFHWVRDKEILQGSGKNVVVRFVDDFEETLSGTRTPSLSYGTDTDTTTIEDEEEPDWKVLSRQLAAKYATEGKDDERLKMEKKNSLPLQGRWCSAY